MTSEPCRPALTVRTPSFTMGRCIDATPDSGRSQHYSNLQHNLVDGASTEDRKKSL